jgi:hypothetical protein
MPRPPAPPPRDSFTGEDQAAYDAVIDRFRRPGWRAEDGEPKLDCHFGTLLHSPPFAAARHQLSSMIRTAGERDNTYSHVDREFADQVLAVHMKTNVVQKRHVPDAVAAGVRVEAIDALRRGDETALTDDERLLARFIRQVVDGEVDDATWEAMDARLGTRGVVEYIFFILLLHMTMRMYQAFGCEDPPDAEIEQIVRGLLEGTVDAPDDWRSRIA